MRAPGTRAMRSRASFSGVLLSLPPTVTSSGTVIFGSSSAFASGRWNIQRRA
ncbi:MAG: hypothetical protein U1F11_05365 [Steroidobacteraceae bacterium]